jgi:hypothetical protein
MEIPLLSELGCAYLMWLCQNVGMNEIKNILNPKSTKKDISFILLSSSDITHHLAPSNKKSSSHREPIQVLDDDGIKEENISLEDLSAAASNKDTSNKNASLLDAIPLRSLPNPSKISPPEQATEGDVPSFASQPLALNSNDVLNFTPETLPQTSNNISESKSLLGKQILKDMKELFPPPLSWIFYQDDHFIASSQQYGSDLSFEATSHHFLDYLKFPIQTVTSVERKSVSFSDVLASTPENDVLASTPENDVLASVPKDDVPAKISEDEIEEGGYLETALKYRHPASVTYYIYYVQFDLPMSEGIYGFISTEIYTDAEVIDELKIRKEHHEALNPVNVIGMYRHKYISSLTELSKIIPSELSKLTARQEEITKTLLSQKNFPKDLVTLCLQLDYSSSPGYYFMHEHTIISGPSKNVFKCGDYVIFVENVSEYNYIMALSPYGEMYCLSADEDEKIKSSHPLTVISIDETRFGIFDRNNIEFGTYNLSSGKYHLSIYNADAIPSNFPKQTLVRSYGTVLEIKDRSKLLPQTNSLTNKVLVDSQKASPIIIGFGADESLILDRPKYMYTNMTPLGVILNTYHAYATNKSTGNIMTIEKNEIVHVYSQDGKEIKKINIPVGYSRFVKICGIQNCRDTFRSPMESKTIPSANEMWMESSLIPSANEVQYLKCYGKNGIQIIDIDSGKVIFTLNNMISDSGKNLGADSYEVIREDGSLAIGNRNKENKLDLTIIDKSGEKRYANAGLLDTDEIRTRGRRMRITELPWEKTSIGVLSDGDDSFSQRIQSDITIKETFSLLSYCNYIIVNDNINAYICDIKTMEIINFDFLKQKNVLLNPWTFIIGDNLIIVTAAGTYSYNFMAPSENRLRINSSIESQPKLRLLINDDIMQYSCESDLPSIFPFGNQNSQMISSENQNSQMRSPENSDSRKNIVMLSNNMFITWRCERISEYSSDSPRDEIVDLLTNPENYTDNKAKSTISMGYLYNKVGELIS